jgi:hypothetical protein
MRSNEKDTKTLLEVDGHKGLFMETGLAKNFQYLAV